MVLVDILIFSILGTIANYLSFAKLPALLVFPISLHFAVAVICISRWGLCGIIPFVFSEIVPSFLLSRLDNCRRRDCFYNRVYIYFLAWQIRISFSFLE